MKLTINGVEEQVEGPANLRAVLDKQGRKGQVAVAVNGAFIPRSAYDETVLAEGDEVEIVAPMQGG